MQTKNIESLAAFDNAKVVSNHFAVVKKDNKYNVFFMRDKNSQNGELVFDDNETSDEDIKFVYNSGEEAIINREWDGLYGYVILKGSEVVNDTYNGEAFFQLVTNSQNYYQIERFNGRRDIIDINGNTQVIPIWVGNSEEHTWVGDHAERTIMYHWQNLYAIKMKNEDNEVYYNVWNVDTDKWLLSNCVDYLRFENTESDKLVSLLSCIKAKGMPKQVIICSKNAVRAYSEIKKLEIKDKKLFIENCLCEFNNDEQVNFIY